MNFVIFTFLETTLYNLSKLNLFFFFNVLFVQIKSTCKIHASPQKLSYTFVKPQTASTWHKRSWL